MSKKTITRNVALTGLVLGSVTLLAGCKSNQASDIVSQMTVEEKVNMVVGTNRALVMPPPPAPGMVVRPKPDFKKMIEAPEDKDAVAFSSKGRVPGAGGGTYELPRLGVKGIVISDGPAGLRIDPKRKGDPGEYYCTAFPTGTALAATWNPEVVESVGSGIGNEVREYGVDVILGPAMNIHRNPLCGRNFEYYGEDPLLAGKMAAVYIRGVQSNHVGTSLKHFAINNQEDFRNGIDVKISQRAMREIYLKGFEIAIKESKPWTVMSSYNKINGTLASENHWLLTELLRGEWGYAGLVMTDWWAEENGARQVAAGNDLQMPGTQHQFDEILQGAKDGSLPMEALDRSVENVLRLVEKTGTGTGYEYSNHPDLSAHAQMTRTAATEGMVLLKNNDGVLPLEKTATVALFGNQSYDTYAGGTGSGNVNRKYKVNIDEGLKKSGVTLLPLTAGLYADYLKEQRKKYPDGNFWKMPVMPELPLTTDAVNRAAKDADIAILTVSRMAGEGDDRTLTKGDYYLNDTETQNLKRICSAFHAQKKKVVMLLNMGCVIQMAEWNDLPDAILHIWLPGQEAGNSVADVLNGTCNPSGKLPMTFAINYKDYPSASNYPVSTADSTEVHYTEDVYVGYRHFDTHHIKPLYPFGYGLSYTTFGYQNLNVTENGGEYTVKVDISNTGSRAGRNVVELFVAAPNSKKPNKPEKELRNYTKTRQLQPGETETVTMKVSTADLASFNEKSSAWVTTPGTYRFLICSSANNIEAEAKVKVKGYTKKVCGLP